MARNQQLIDGRKETTRELAERALALPDPVEPQAPTLAELLHPGHAHLAVNTRNFILSGLAPWRSDVPIVAPDLHQLRPMLYACSGGHNQSFDISPAWRLIFGTHGDAMQARVRSLWQSVREVKYPAPAQYEQLVNALANFIIDVFKQAAEQQRERLEKAEAERGITPRAQTAAQVLEQLVPFRAALEQFTKVHGQLGWGELKGDLNRLERAARSALS